MQVEIEMEAGARALPECRAKVKAAADLMTTILQQSAESVFKCASQVMTTNRIFIPATEIQDDFEQAALAQVKQFTENSVHVPFLQGMRENGRVSTTVKTPMGEEIDTRVFGNQQARHCETNNRLDEVELVEVKAPSLFPSGSTK